MFSTTCPLDFGFRSYLCSLVKVYFFVSSFLVIGKIDGVYIMRQGIGYKYQSWDRCFHIKRVWSLFPALDFLKGAHQLSRPLNCPNR